MSPTRIMLESRIHRARLTECNLAYEGSITIDRALMEEADILPFEQVQVLDIDSGARLTTDAIEGGPGEIRPNGAAARLVTTGDLVMMPSYANVVEREVREHRPTLVQVDANNVSNSTIPTTEAAIA